MSRSIRYVVRPKRNPQERDEAPKYYAVVASRGTTTTRELAENISSATTFQLPDVVAVLAALQLVVCEELAKGNTVSLGSLGYLKMTMNSKGAATGKDYKVGDMVRGVNCRFITSKHLKLTSAASFTKGHSTLVSTDSTDPDDTGSTDTGSTGSGSAEQVFIGTAVNDSTMGSVSGSGTYDKGEAVTLVANANEGYRFLQWTDDVLDNPRTVTADVSGVIYTAVFEAK